MTATLPSNLVDSAWLEHHLAEPRLRIFDCTVIWHSDPDGAWYESGRTAWAAGHIPGSDFVDLIEELSDPATDLPFMLPSAERFAAAMSQHGVSEDTAVVLYDASFNMWAARVWWLLRAFGFDNAAILNGGWHKWQLEGRPVSTDHPIHRPGRFEANPRPGMFVGKPEMLAALAGSGECLVNVLERENFREGRIPQSLNVPWTDLVDMETQAYLDEPALQQAFVKEGVLNEERVITYCRAGILASSAAFLLSRLGRSEVSVYDGSLYEWLADDASPVETG